MRWSSFALFCTLAFAIIFTLDVFATENPDYEGCSEAQCGPRVSKCMLIKSCNCSMTPDDLKHKNCSCCKDCFQCLGDLFSECCSCVGLCRPSREIASHLALRSYVETLKPADDQLSLFELVTSEPLPSDAKWTVKTYPALDPGFFYEKFNISAQKLAEYQSLADSNCTVAFLKQCLSVEKCRNACSSMGASYYRWFHTGCCECVGRSCLNYGWREGLCEECGELEDSAGNTVTGAKGTDEL